LSEVNLDESLEIAPGLSKRLGDCSAAELESAIRLIVAKRIDRAWISEQASGPDEGRPTVARRFFALTSEAERDLIAYWHVVQLIEEESARRTEEDA
jgi:hypothetical protein